MIIDFHAHPGYAHELAAQRQEVAAILQEAAFHGVAWVCLSSLADWSASPTPEAVRTGNDAVLALVAEHPDHLIPFCYVNPVHTGAALEELDRCVAAGAAGVKLWIACKLDEECVRPVLDRAAGLRLPVLQHCSNRPPREHTTPADAAAAAARHPETQIVLAHSAFFGDEGFAEIAPYANVHADFAGSEPEALLVERGVRWLGAERVLFGTDTPIRSFGSSLGRAYEAKLSARERALILGGNAQRLLGRSFAR